jgi:putative transposase
VATLFHRHRGRYASPRITAELRETGWRVSAKTVAAVMAEQGLIARPPRRGKNTTRPGRGRWRAADLVRRDLTAQRVNQRWFGDGTEVLTREGRLHLASVLDIYSRRIVGVRPVRAPRHRPGLRGVGHGCGGSRRQVAGVVLHTDGGSGVHLPDFRAACARLGITQSMGRPGSALDSAAIELWHTTLTFELLHLEHLATKAQARRRVAAWIR